LTPARLARVVADFEARYLRTYGPASAATGTGYVLRNYKAVATAPRPKPALSASAISGAAAARGRRRAWSPVSRSFVEMDVYAAPLPEGALVSGPAILEFEDTSVVVFDGDTCTVDGLGNTIVELGA